ncbi:hypothetical protein [Desulfovibrio inopinatus]|uniref:hypothetical protein n=1 Tax=Desulfovibrio inopinatus TaxID=102109 RepID=UPI0004833CA6|nr:hypothetical protein [Desulfovibrio inopinatus]
MATPLVANTNLICEIVDRATDGPLTEFELARFTKQAEALKGESPAIGVCALAIIASLKGDIDVARQLHERALSLSPEAVLHYNYAGTLVLYGFMPEAAEQAVLAADNDDMNLKYLNKAILLTFVANNDELYRLLERWTKLTNGEAHPVVLELEKEEQEDVNDALEAVDTPIDECIPWTVVKQGLNLQ